METALVVGLVGGGVSLLSIVGAIFTTRKTLSNAKDIQKIMIDEDIRKNKDKKSGRNGKILRTPSQGGI